MFAYIFRWIRQGILKGGGKYHFTIDLLLDWFGISCMTTDNICFSLQNRLIETSQIGGQWYSNTSPFSIPWIRFKGRIHSSLFSSQLTNWPNKPECYITVGWKCSSETNTLAFGTQL
jgi:hypothetical protein